MPMQSRTDQVHSYQFFLQRVISGLVAKESDPAELPYRRLGWAGFGSFMIAILLAAGFGVYGIVVGGGATSWRDGESVVLERESGQVYIYRDERLHPMANLVSAQLALEGDGQVTRVSARSLAGVPRGVTLGIVGAPGALPSDGELYSGGWALCTEQRPDGRGGRETVSVLAVAERPPGGQAVAGEALLVRDVDAAGPDAELHLLWRGHRHQLDGGDRQAALRALGVSRERAAPVASAWLDSLPAGDPLRPPPVTGRGEASRAVAAPPAGLDLRVGQVVASAGTFYLVAEAELVELTPLAADLLLADPATAAAYPDGVPDVRADVPAGLLATAPLQPLPEPTATSPPEQRPQFATLLPEDLRDGALCAAFTPDGFTPTLLAGARLPWVGRAVATPGQTAQGSLLADQVLMDGGGAVLVEAMSSPQAAGGSWHIVTDQGVRYALPEPGVVTRLGYQPEQAVRLPASLLARLPSGPPLDPAAALLPAVSAAGT